MKRIPSIPNRKTFLLSLALISGIHYFANAAENDHRVKSKKNTTAEAKQNANQLMLQSNKCGLNKNWLFEENKGQLRDEKNKPVADVLYYIHNGMNNVICRPGKISFVFAKVENDPQTSEATCAPWIPVDINELNKETNQNQVITYQRMDFVLTGCNSHALVMADDQQAYYENYYKDKNPADAITHVRSFKKLTYKNIYPLIDMELIVDQGHNMEYSFVIHRGGNVEDIKMQWEGAQSQEITANKNPEENQQVHVRYSTEMGCITESNPQSFSGGEKIASSFICKNGNTGFKVGHYDKTRDLLIDPTLFATYYGGSSDDYGIGLCLDGSGNMNITGYTASSNLPVTAGVFQSTLASNPDAFVAQFASSGSLSWATYFGGSNIDKCRGNPSADASGNINVPGVTASSNFPVTGSPAQSSLVGSENAFIAQFSSSGSLNWSTYFGVSEEAATGVMTDGSGNLYVCGVTEETQGAGGLATAGAFQTVNNGVENSWVAKFSSSGAVGWFTYFGGSDIDQANAIATDGTNVYITGNAESPDLPTTSGVYQTGLNGLENCFIAQFGASSGVLNWSTYYGGAGQEISFGLALDGSGDAFITGRTTGSTGLATSGAYQTTNGGGFDAFFAELNSSGTSLLLGSYLGGPAYDQGSGISIDGSGNIDIAGFSMSTSNVASPGAAQASNGGGYDMLIAQFNSSAGLNWATYFGGSGDDFGEAEANDGSGKIYVLGYTKTANGLASPGAFRTSNAGSNTNDAFLTEYSSAGIAPLPVTLLDFEAGLDNNKVSLHWTTASEINNDYFSIERSMDGVSWQDIGQVPGHGNSQVKEYYSFIDNLQGFTPVSTIYYRLKQEDNNGSYQYSMIRSVELNEPSADFTTYPNPVFNTLNVNWIIPENSSQRLRITNITGSVVYSEKLSGGGIMPKQLDVSAYPAGAYVIEAVSGNDIISSRSFIKE